MSKILRLSEVIKVTGLSRATIYRLENANKFPKRHKIGPRIVGWTDDDIQKWISSLKKGGLHE